MMTMGQYLHHQEQSEAARLEFFAFWDAKILPQLIGFSERELIGIKVVCWLSFSHSKGIK